MSSTPVSSSSTWIRAQPSEMPTDTVKTESKTSSGHTVALQQGETSGTTSKTQTTATSKLGTGVPGKLKMEGSKVEHLTTESTEGKKTPMQASSTKSQTVGNSILNSDKSIPRKDSISTHKMNQEEGLLIPLDRAKALLDGQPPGTSILRFSVRHQDFFVVTQGEAKERPLSDEHKDILLSQGLEGLQKSMQIKTPTGIKKEAAVEQQKLIEKDEIKLPDTQKYDHQVILSLGSGATAKALGEKWGSKNSKDGCSIIDLKDAKPDTSSIGKLTQKSRVYVVGHCSVGANTIEADDDKKLSVSDLADMIEKNAPNIKQKGSKKLNVSLVACNSGRGSRTHPSFAQRLSEELSKRGIPAEVTGRTLGVGRNVTDKKMVGGLHARIGRKITYTTSQNKTSVKSTEETYGEMSRPDAEAILQPHKEGSALLRYSDNAKGFVLSFKNKDGEMKHEPLGDKSFKQALEAFRIFHVVRPGEESNNGDNQVW